MFNWSEVHFYRNNFLRNLYFKYSRRGCELECAGEKAASFCKCIPWHYPNNNMLNTPTCDIFGGHCFDKGTFLSEDTY